MLVYLLTASLSFRLLLRQMVAQKKNTIIYYKEQCQWTVRGLAVLYLNINFYLMILHCLTSSREQVNYPVWNQIYRYTERKEQKYMSVY